MNIFIKLFCAAFIVHLCKSGNAEKIIPQDLENVPIHLEDDSSVIMRCSKSNYYNLEKFTWETPLRRFENVAEEQDDRGISVVLRNTSINYEYTLRIDKFSEENEGEHFCLMQSEGQSWFDAKRYYLKRKIPQNITIFKDTEQNLVCESRGDKAIDWYRNGEIISRRKSPSHLVELESDVLMLENAQLEDSGLYECRVITEQGYFTTGFFQLNVISHEDAEKWNIKPKNPPSRTSYYGPYGQKSDFSEGLKVELDCSCLDCWPLTSFYWLTPFGNFSTSKDENFPKGFSLSQRVVKFPYVGEYFKFLLTIEIAWKKHEGNYTCVLENSLGKVQKVSQVIVKESDFVVEKAATFEGYRVKLHGNHSKSNTYWSADKNDKSSQKVTEYNTYSIFPARINDSGLYLAKDFNSEWKAYIYKALNLKILSSTEELPMRVNKLKEGKRTRLICGDEDSTNRVWTHNGRVIQYPNFCPVNKVLSLRPVRDRMLTIDGKFSNSGLYRCNYSDAEGMLYRKKFLIMVEPRKAPKLQPEIPEIPSIHSTNPEEGTIVTVKRDFLYCEDYIVLGCKCKESCQPLLQYNWTVPEMCQKTSEKIEEVAEDEEGFTYTIKFPVHSNCNGIFTCTVSNSKGVSTHDFQLHTEFTDKNDYKKNYCCPNEFEMSHRSHPDISCGGW